MQRTVNEAGNDGCSITEALPSASEARRLRREAKAIETVKAMKGSRPQKEPEVVEFPSDPGPDDLVYFMYSAGLIKIGYTTDIYRRLNDLTNMGGAPIVLIGVLPATIQYERMLHRIFKADRKHGEWFHLSDQIRRFLQCLDDAASVTMPPEVLPTIGSCLARLEQAEKQSRSELIEKEAG